MSQVTLVLHEVKVPVVGGTEVPSVAVSYGANVSGGTYEGPFAQGETALDDPAVLECAKALLRAVHDTLVRYTGLGEEIDDLPPVGEDKDL